MKYFFYILLPFIIASCTRDEALITGSISGRLSLYDQFHKKISDASGAEVSLEDSLGLVLSTVTDAGGKYSFEEVPYGRYELVPSKDRFIRTKNPNPVYHIGGYSPTMTSLSLFEIPTFDVSLDSAAFFPDDGYLIVYLKLNGGTTLPPNTYGLTFIAFSGSTPDVSKDKHEWIWKGIFADYSFGQYPTVTVNVYGMIPSYSFSNNFNPQTPGTFYMRVYPLAGGQGYYTTDFYPEALGKPSNVPAFA
ncbi:MAG: carboxypeptidase-like regulatory domain-containing protein, partial [Bacteroidales bacterium]|nr:carboxypeptidase-like regulatory domain-containing protein [Bacteroidales bacterium]